MAYADKITTMRRMALIPKEGTIKNIVWEGVNIEGTCLLRNYCNGCIMVKNEKEVLEFCETDDYDFPLVCVYQDKKDAKEWEPRKRGYKW